MFRIKQITSLHDLNEKLLNGCDFSHLNIYRNANDIRKKGKNTIYFVFIFSVKFKCSVNYNLKLIQDICIMYSYQC